jgi:Transposase IS116/IS110/IS902 family
VHSGAAPIPASSGQTVRVRLNRSGDRQLNQALHLIVLTRLRHDPATRAYAQRRRAQGKTNREIKRSLVRYVARQLYRLLEHPRFDPTYEHMSVHAGHSAQLGGRRSAEPMLWGRRPGHHRTERQQLHRPPERQPWMLTEGSAPAAYAYHAGSVSLEAQRDYPRPSHPDIG